MLRRYSIALEMRRVGVALISSLLQVLNAQLLVLQLHGLVLGREEKAVFSPAHLEALVGDRLPLPLPRLLPQLSAQSRCPRSELLLLDADLVVD
jgi:hypothetical protein